MTAATVADDVHHHVLVELLTVVEGNLSNSHHSLWVIAVDVENRSLNALCKIGGIGGGSGILWQGGETNLVVHDYVNCSAYFVTL